MKSYKNHILATAIALLLFTSSCGKDDTSPTPLQINFTNTEMSLLNSAEVGITFSRAAETAGSITLSVLSSSLVYGVDADFYTEPALVGNEIELPYEAGDESLTLTIYPGAALNIAEDATITLELGDGNDLVVGSSSFIVITISENFIAQSGTMEINGGGADFPNQSFIDLSKLSQSTVDKYSWDLGFSSTSIEHHVVLNSSAYVMARAIESTDIDQVGATDTVGFAAKMYLSNYVDGEASGWIDNQNGDLSDTAFGSISSTDSGNKVFIVKRDGEDRNWKKVRVLQDGENYTIQYADIDATSHSELSISKDAAYNFTFLDLDNGVTNVEPEKEKWDLMYSTYSGRANYGQFLAIGYNDYIVLNRSEVSAAMVAESEFSYSEFSLDDISNVSLVSDNISVIGSSWRGLVDFSLVLNEDVYYVISDSEGNHYKLKFTRLTSETDERGYPEFKFELL